MTAPAARFVVYRAHGAAWNPSLPMREQAAWPEHARFMNALASQGFVVLGGPLGDGARTLLVIEAPSEQAVRARLAEDPWATMQLLRIDSIEPWSILLAHDAARTVPADAPSASSQAQAS